jgi:hypothetical protein
VEQETGMPRTATECRKINSTKCLATSHFRQNLYINPTPGAINISKQESGDTPLPLIIHDPQPLLASVTNLRTV